MYLTRNIFLASCKDENGEMILSLLHVKNHIMGDSMWCRTGHSEVLMACISNTVFKKLNVIYGKDMRH